MPSRTISKLLLLITAAVYFQSTHVYAKNWESFPNSTLGIGLAATTTGLAYELNSPSGDSPLLKYQPNLSGQINLIANYGALSTSIALGNRSSDDQAEYGKSDGHDYQFRFYGLKWTPEFIYQKYNGFYLYNTQDIGVAPNLTSAKYYLRPDLQVETINFNLYYNFSPDNYSLASHFGLSKRQIESGGATFATLNFNNTKVSADSPIVPTQYQSSYGPTGDMTSFDSYSLSLGAAGAYNFVYKDFYFGGLLGLSLSTQQSKINALSTRSHTDTSYNANSNIKLGFGYNGKKANVGLSLENDSVSMKINSHKSVIDSSIAKMSIVYRLEDTHIETLQKINEEYFSNNP